MNLSELHQRLSKKPTYRKAYDAIGDVVLIGAAVRKLREDAEVTQQELASKLEISQFYLSRLETGSGRVSPDVVSAVVRHFEEELRGLGINVEPWLAAAPAAGQNNFVHWIPLQNCRHSPPCCHRGIGGRSLARQAGGFQTGKPH